MPMMPTTTTAHRVFPMDIPSAIFDAIRREPDHEPHWLALEAHHVSEFPALRAGVPFTGCAMLAA
jgi:hypothetical protein